MFPRDSARAVFESAPGKFFRNGGRGQLLPTVEFNDDATDAKLGFVGYKSAVFHGEAVGAGGAPIVRRVGHPTGCRGSNGDSETMKPRQDNGLCDAEFLRDLCSRLRVIYEQVADFFGIEHLRLVRDLNKISEIAGVLTVFGLVDHFYRPRKSKIPKTQFP